MSDKPIPPPRRKRVSKSPVTELLRSSLRKSIEKKARDRARRVSFQSSGEKKENEESGVSGQKSEISEKQKSHETDFTPDVPKSGGKKDDSLKPTSFSGTVFSTQPPEPKTRFSRFKKPQVPAPKAAGDAIEGKIPPDAKYVPMEHEPETLPDLPENVEKTTDPQAKPLGNLPQTPEKPSDPQAKPEVSPGSFPPGMDSDEPNLVFGPGINKRNKQRPQLPEAWTEQENRPEEIGAVLSFFYFFLEKVIGTAMGRVKIFRRTGSLPWNCEK